MSIFSGAYHPYLHLDGIQFDVILEEDALWPDHPFEEKVEFVVLGCRGDKALGLDEFPLAFFYYCWNVVQYDVMGMCEEFQEHCRFERSLNATFMALIL